MGYNISTFKIRSLSLILPLDFDFQAWLKAQPDRDERGYENYGKRDGLRGEDHVSINFAAQTWELPQQRAYLSGVIANNQLVATEIDCTSDGSATIYNDILLPLFGEFKGSVSAITIWEGGQSVYDLSIVDGVVEDIEIG